MAWMINLIIDQEPNSLNQLYDEVDQHERVFSIVSRLALLMRAIRVISG